MTLLGAFFVAFLGAVVSGKITTFFLNGFRTLFAPTYYFFSVAVTCTRSGEFGNQLERSVSSKTTINKGMRKNRLIRVSRKGVKKKTLD